MRFHTWIPTQRQVCRMAFNLLSTCGIGVIRFQEYRNHHSDMAEFINESTVHAHGKFAHVNGCTNTSMAPFALTVYVLFSVCVEKVKPMCWHDVCSHDIKPNYIWSHQQPCSRPCCMSVYIHTEELVAIAFSAYLPTIIAPMCFEDYDKQRQAGWISYICILSWWVGIILL